MKTIMAAKNTHDSFSFSRRYFHWKKKAEDHEDGNEEILNYGSSNHQYYEELKVEELDLQMHALQVKPPKKKLSIVAVSKLRSAFTFGKSSHFSGLGSKLVGTLFGFRRGHVHFAFQEDPKSCPALLIELATPTSNLVKEMASGTVRIALECDKKTTGKKGVKLLEESIWRAYCNGRKCGYAMRHECGPEESKILKSIGPITMGAGVLPGPDDSDGVGSEGELMYMRAQFERVVGSKNSEAFYMINPDGHAPHGGPELSIYMLRV